MYRITPYRLTCILILLVCSSLLAYRVLGVDKFKIKVCSLSQGRQEQLLSTMDIVQQILKQMGTTYVLCYQSLVGQIRYGGPFSWEDTGSLCVINEEMVKFEDAYIEELFNRKGLDVSYNSWDGQYLIKPKSETNPLVSLVLFSSSRELQDMGDESQLHRVGWARKLLPSHCGNNPSLECFPSRLLDNPLDSAKFGSSGLEFPVPRETIELVKYQYPGNWWEEVKSPNC